MPSFVYFLFFYISYLLSSNVLSGYFHVYSFTVKSKVFQILTYIRQERPNEQYRNTVNDLRLPNTVSQKDEKPHTAIPQIKIKITEIPLEKKLNTAIL